LTLVLVGAGELFEEVGVLNWTRYLIVAAGPFAQIDATATVGAKWKVFVAGEDDITAGRATKRFDGRCRLLRHGIFILTPQS
jgi:hypothetical protein